jgi:hypothetical protein
MLAWADLHDRRNALRFGIAWVVFLTALGLCSMTVNYMDGRAGQRLSDSLHVLQPVNFTYAILALEYLCIGIGMRHALRCPENFIRLGYCYSLLFFLRTISLLAVPLAAPEGAIPLTDPLVQLFTGGVYYHMNDLFFSGHTAFCFINFFLVPRGVQRWVILTCSVLVGTMLIVQRVHYTVDVLTSFVAVLILIGLKSKASLLTGLFSNF